MGFLVDSNTMLTYLIVLFISFLGIYVGVTLAFITPKEIGPGKKYLQGMQNAILVFIACLLLYIYGAPVWLLALLAIVASITLYLTTEATPVNQIAFFLLGVAFFFSTKTADTMFVTAILIFIYGMPLGSIYVERHAKDSKATILTDVIIKYFLYIVLGLLTHLIATKLAAL